MRILVVGAGGQVGRKLVHRARVGPHVVRATYRSQEPQIVGVEAARLDKTQRREVEKQLGEFRPELVIDLGALHNVDYCEQHPEEAFAVNRTGTGHLAEVCRAMNARYLFVSTDYVFDGTGSPPYSEDDSPRPQSAYARSKLEGERLALEKCPNAAVARPSVIFSWVPLTATAETSSGKPLNFASWLIRELVAGKEARIVDDQVASPTLADDLAAALLALGQSAARGVFHTAGATPMDRYSFAERLARRVGAPLDRLRRISSTELRQVAPRPSNSSLRSVRLQREVGYTMMEISTALDAFALEMKDDPGVGVQFGSA
jgi:dTDP-4-dehydrorhamnose reductase